MCLLCATATPISPFRFGPFFASIKKRCNSLTSSELVSFTAKSLGSNEQKTIISRWARVTATFKRRYPPSCVTGPKLSGTLLLACFFSPGSSFENATEKITVSASSPWTLSRLRTFNCGSATTTPVSSSFSGSSALSTTDLPTVSAIFSSCIISSCWGLLNVTTIIDSTADDLPFSRRWIRSGSRNRLITSATTASASTMFVRVSLTVSPEPRKLRSVTFFLRLNWPSRRIIRRAVEELPTIDGNVIIGFS